MKKIVSLLIAMVFSLSISAFALAEVKPAADAAGTKVEEKKAEPAAKKKATKKKHHKKKKAAAKKAEKAEKAPEMPAEKK
jgi:mannitol-specific phosphotransferase system IIBC component